MTFDESTCDRCGRDNPAWSTPPEVWQAVYGPGGQPTRQGVLCPSCFIDDAQAAGVAPLRGAPGWLVTPGAAMNNRGVTTCLTFAAGWGSVSGDTRGRPMPETGQSPHTVWLLWDGHDYYGPDLAGVYADKQAAIDARTRRIRDQADRDLRRAHDRHARLALRGGRPLFGPGPHPLEEQVAAIQTQLRRALDRDPYEDTAGWFVEPCEARGREGAGD